MVRGERLALETENWARTRQAWMFISELRQPRLRILPTIPCCKESYETLKVIL